MQSRHVFGSEGGPPTVGSRVRVRSPDGEELGDGEYVGEVEVRDLGYEFDIETASKDEGEKLLMLVMLNIMIEDGETTPIIVLDSGETIYGFECDWELIDKGKSMLN